MNWFEKHINPLTYERLRRFTEIKRGWYSFIILAIAYALSLGAEFICGNQPLYVRYENTSYFPTLKFYPEDTFTGNGRGTRPDYKAIRTSDSFKSNAKNFMIFPLIPFGPEEIIDPATIAVENEVEVAISKESRTGTVNLDSGLIVKRSDAAGSFFGNATDPTGLKLSDYLDIGPDLRAGDGDAISESIRSAF